MMNNPKTNREKDDDDDEGGFEWVAAIVLCFV